MRIHRTVIARELIPPNDCQQVIPREHAPRRRGQRVQQLNLPPRQVQLVPGQRDGQRRQVNRQLADHQHFLFRRRRDAPKHRANPRHHLAGGKRLDDVIVRADIQPENPIRVLVLGGNHQNRHARHPADAAADLQSVQPRQHDIQQDQRRLGRVEQGERLLAGLRRQHRPPLFFDVLRQNIDDLRVVVHHQNRIHVHPSSLFFCTYCKIGRQECQTFCSNLKFWKLFLF